MTKHKIDLWAPGFREGGGIQAFSQEVARGLADFQVGLLPRERYEGKKRNALAQRTASLRFALSLFRSAVIRRPDLIVSTHINFGPVASIIRKYLGIPYVLVAHGIDVSPDVSASRQSALKRASKIAAVSRFTANKVAALTGVPPHSIAVLPNTVDDVRYSPGEPDGPLLRRFNIPQGRKLILTVGRLSKSEQYKGYDIVIRAMPAICEKVPEAHYVVCGAGDDSDRVRHLVSSLNLDDRVTLTGFVEAEALPAMYRCAQTFAMPSTGEGFGIVYLEAMASGVPVLAGNCDGSVDALADGELGKLIDPLNVHDVADGISQLLLRQGPPWWFEPMNLRQNMLRKFGRAEFAKKLHDIVECALSRPAPDTERI